MADEDVRRRFLSYLDEHAFEPVLKARPEDHPQDQRDRLTEMQEAIRSERDRFQRCGTAVEVYEMFEEELRSEPARKAHRELRELDLPTLEDVRLDFQQMAGELGIRGESTFTVRGT
jgi:hypothetical protein